MAGLGVACLAAYGSVALYTGHNGNMMTLVISTIGGIIAGTVGFALGRKESK